MVTRPAHQAERLCALITAAGGVPVPLPVLSIKAPRDLAPARALLARMNAFDIAIFVSANAAERGLALLHGEGHDLPPRLKLAAVGRRTAAVLLNLGGRIDIQAPPPYNSEALLATPELQAVANKNIVIFRGDGGRELLAETLRQRGAKVEYAEVYRRIKPEGGFGAVLQGAGEIDIVVVTSQDGLRNLVEMADAAGRGEWLAQRQLAAISPRVAHLAAELGFRRPALVAAHATDEALLQVITTWRQSIQAAQ